MVEPLDSGCTPDACCPLGAGTPFVPKRMVKGQAHEALIPNMDQNMTSPLAPLADCLLLL
jgi:hypothetical protein